MQDRPQVQPQQAHEADNKPEATTTASLHSAQFKSISVLFADRIAMADVGKKVLAGLSCLAVSAGIVYFLKQVGRSLWWQALRMRALRLTFLPRSLSASCPLFHLKRRPGVRSSVRRQKPGSGPKSRQSGRQPPRKTPLQLQPVGRWVMSTWRGLSLTEYHLRHYDI